MKQSYKCPHEEFEVYGSNQEVYCRECKSLVYSDKDKKEIKKQEMSLNKDKQQ